MTLLEPRELRALDAMSRRSSTSRGALGFGAEISRALGGVTEFAERRPYAASDDPRHIDWLAYARSRQPVVKRFHSERVPLVRILLDCSGSMNSGSPSKFRLAQRLTAALGYLALCAGSRVQLFAGVRAGETSTTLSALGELDQPRAVERLFSLIERCTAEGRTELESWLARVGSVGRHATSLFVVSDLLSGPDLLRSLDELRHRGHALGLLQVLSLAELSPSLHGDLSLECVETGERLDVSVDRLELEAYQRNLHAWFSALSSWARKHGQIYVRAASADDPIQTLLRLVQGRSDEP